MFDGESIAATELIFFSQRRADDQGIGSFKQLNPAFGIFFRVFINLPLAKIAVHDRIYTD